MDNRAVEIFRDKKSAEGVQVPNRGVAGRLVVGFAENACSRIEKPSSTKDYTTLVPTICLLVMILFMTSQLIKCVSDPRSIKRRSSSKHRKKLPTTKYKKGDQYDTCAICLDEYSEGEKLQVLPCHHVYHMKCIDPWLTKNSEVCPMCKAKVKFAGMSDESNSAAATERTHLFENNRSTRGSRRKVGRRHRNTQTNVPFPVVSLIHSTIYSHVFDELLSATTSDQFLQMKVDCANLEREVRELRAATKLFRQKTNVYDPSFQLNEK